MLVILTGIPYSVGMAIASKSAAIDPAREERASYVLSQIKGEDRSVRYVAQRIGLPASSLGDRLRGKVAFTAEDIESIARVLRRDPVNFYREYLESAQLTESRPSDYKAPVPSKTRPTNRRDRNTGPSNRAR